MLQGSGLGRCPNLFPNFRGRTERCLLHRVDGGNVTAAPESKSPDLSFLHPGAILIALFRRPLKSTRGKMGLSTANCYFSASSIMASQYAHASPGQ